ncbi:MAG: hypothetical protein KBA15_04080, partial [Spirochaetes bacterium]|nr:hypothetical protein [Spirochaetota bacterium]
DHADQENADAAEYGRDHKYHIAPLPGNAKFAARSRAVFPVYAYTIGVCRGGDFSIILLKKYPLRLGLTLPAPRRKQLNGKPHNAI